MACLWYQTPSKTTRGDYVMSIVYRNSKLGLARVMAFAILTTLAPFVSA